MDKLLIVKVDQSWHHLLFEEHCKRPRARRWSRRSRAPRHTTSNDQHIRLGIIFIEVKTMITIVLILLLTYPLLHTGTLFLRCSKVSHQSGRHSPQFRRTTSTREHTDCFDTCVANMKRQRFCREIKRTRTTPELVGSTLWTVQLIALVSALRLSVTSPSHGNAGGAGGVGDAGELVQGAGGRAAAGPVVRRQEEAKRA